MPVTPIIAPSLFDAVSDYAKAIVKDKDPSSDLPTDFCDNFFTQFFENRMHRNITNFGKQGAQVAIDLRLDLTADDPWKEKKEVVQLVASFERYCDVRYDVKAETYGESSSTGGTVFVDYLKVLLQYIADWTRAENLDEIRQRSEQSLAELNEALRGI